MTTTTRTRLWAVRATYDDPTGTATHEFIYGPEPTVHRSKAAADRHVDRLQAETVDCDWGDNEPPVYYVEEITAADLWAAEEVADNLSEEVEQLVEEVGTHGVLQEMVEIVKRNLNMNDKQARDFITGGYQ